MSDPARKKSLYIYYIDEQLKELYKIDEVFKINVNIQIKTTLNKRKLFSIS